MTGTLRLRVDEGRSSVTASGRSVESGRSQARTHGRGRQRCRRSTRRAPSPRVSSTSASRRMSAAVWRRSKGRAGPQRRSSMVPVRACWPTSRVRLRPRQARHLPQDSFTRPLPALGNSPWPDRTSTSRTNARTSRAGPAGGSPPDRSPRETPEGRRASAIVQHRVPRSSSDDPATPLRLALEPGAASLGVGQLWVLPALAAGEKMGDGGSRRPQIRHKGKQA